MREKSKQLDTPEKVLDAMARIGEEPGLRHPTVTVGGQTIKLKNLKIQFVPGFDAIASDHFEGVESTFTFEGWWE